MPSKKISTDFEKQHLRRIKNQQNLVKRAYQRTVNNIFQKVGSIRQTGQAFFRISDYPEANAFLRDAMQNFHDEITVIIGNGSDLQWSLAEQKNDEILNTLLDGRTSERVKSILFQRNTDALEAFQKRQVKGLNLSDRVWKYTNQFQSEIEQGLFVGISEGKPATEMARDQIQYLQEPDKLFRRVKDAKGRLVLSKNAKQYKPGRGIYRSSFKNALRLTRTENNIAYRTADHERWSKSPYILGIDVLLSNNHPRYDMCDRLVGPYPATYKHTGFHPQCLCFAVPRLPSKEEFSKYEDAVLSGTDKKFRFKDKVREVPNSALKWVDDNRERLKGQKSIPYFIKDNQKFLPKI